MTIINKPSGLSLSGNLDSFRINTEEQISFILKTGSDVIVSQTYNPGSDNFVIIDLRDIIESYLSFTLRDITDVYRQENLAKTFTAVINTEEITFRVIHAGVDQLTDTTESFLKHNFLTWQPQIKQVTYSSPEFLTYYAVQPAVVRIKVYFNDSDHREPITFTYAELTAGEAYTIPLQYATLANKLFEGSLPEGYDVFIETPEGSRLTYIQRYILSSMLSEEEQWILFENSLGGLDTMRAYGATNFKAEHTHNIAEVDEISSEYRVDTERKFQKHTGFLNKKERIWLLDFFPSKKKYIIIDSTIRPIVVVESDVNYNETELPSNYNFTYKYADAKPLLNLPRIGSMPPSLNISSPGLGSITIPPRLVDFPRLPVSEGLLFPVQSPYSEDWGTITVSSLQSYLSGSKIPALNISIAFPASGANGTNIYTHNNAIAIVPNEYRNPGLIIIFLYQLNTDTVIPVSYRYDSTDISKWTSIGNWTKLPGAIPLSGINSLIKPELCGEYSVTNMGKCVASLSVTTDSMSHVVNQYIRTNLIPDERGELGSTHDDSTVNVYVRIYNINAPNSSITKGTWGNWIKQPGGIVSLAGLNSLTTPGLCGIYSVVEFKRCIASLTVTSDSMGHVMNQFIHTNLILNEGGEFDGTHEDSTINVYMRIYNINAPNVSIPKGTWGRWIRFATENDIRISETNRVRYFGGVLESCMVETSTYTGDIAPGNVYYTERAGLPGLPLQYIPTFVGQVGDKYYRQFKNINSYSITGINLDAGRIYLDINNKLIYVANPDYLYGVIRIGSERAVTQEEILTQAEYDALGSYDDNTRYYIIEG